MSGKALPISKGGTGQTTAAGARLALGISGSGGGQPADADLDALSALAGTGVAVRTAADTWALRTLQAPAAGFTITNPAGVAGDPTFVLANDLNALEGIGTTGLAARTAANTWTTRTLTAPAAGFTITDGDGVAGNPTFVLANDLAGLEGIGTTGIAVRTAANTWTTRSLTAPAAGITISNNDGVAGSPTFALADDLAAVEGLAANGMAARTAASTWAVRTITGTANEISVADGNGVSANPTISIPAAVTFTGKTITGGTFSGPTISGAPTAAGATWTDLGSVTTIDINGGTVDGATVGAASASTGAFTTLSASGLISANGGQIAFPAAQSASANANTLDDYEEGTFTPTITASAGGNVGTYTTQEGAYTKIGQAVLFNCWMVWTAHTGTGTIKIGALPFTAAATPSVNPVALTRSNLTAANPQFAYVEGGATTVQLGTAASAAAFTALAMDTAASLGAHGYYRV